MELVVIGILLIIITYIFRKFSAFVYSFAIFDIFFRIIHFLKGALMPSNITNFVNEYIPSSIFALIHKYTSGLFLEILIWCYVVIFIILEFYLIKILLKNK